MYHNPVPLGPDLVSSSTAYALRFAGPVGAWMIEVQTRGIEELLAGWDDEGTILDVGGGHAQITPPLLDRGRDVTTLISGVSAGTRLESLTGGRAHCMIGNVEDLSLPDGSFDVVIALRMMAHVSDWRRFLASLCRVARKGVIVDFPLSGGCNALTPLLYGVKKAIEGDTRPYTSLRRRDIVAAFADEGLAADRAIGQFVLPMAAHRFVHQATVSRSAEALLRPLAPFLGNPVLMRARR